MENQKRVKVKVRLDKNNDPVVEYECEGYGGTTCEEVGDLMAMLGSVQNKETTEDAHRIPNELPNPLNQTS